MILSLLLCVQTIPQVRYSALRPSDWPSRDRDMRSLRSLYISKVDRAHVAYAPLPDHSPTFSESEMGIKEVSDSPDKGDRYGDEELVPINVESSPVADWTEAEERQATRK